MNIVARPPLELAAQLGPAAERRRIIIAVIVSASFLMQGVDTTLLTTAIPTMARELGVTPVTLHFTITAYIIALAVFMPVSGWFADRFGPRRVFCGSLALYTLCSFLCAMVADNLSLLIGCRLLQGCCGALMTPVGRLILLRAFGANRVLDAMTYLSMPTLIGPLLGPLLGGAIVNYLSWRLVFFVTAPLCAAAIIGALRYVDADEPGHARPFDFKGFLLIGASLSLFQIGVENLSHPFAGTWGGAGLFIGCGALGVTYWRYARGKFDPALDISLFRVSEFRVGVIAGSIGRTGLNAMQFLLPIVLQVGFGFNPMTSGAISFCTAIGSMSGKTFIRRLLHRFGFRWTLSALAALGGVLMMGLSLFAAPLLVPAFIFYVLMMGMMRSLHFNTVNTLTYTAVPQSKLSRSVASAGVFQQISMGLGTSLSAATLAFSAGFDTAPVLADFGPTFIAMGIIPLLSLPVLWQLNVDVGRKLSGEKPAHG